MDNLQSLLPRHKSDDANARAIVALGYPAVKPVLPQLLKWLQDYNWPIAQVFAPFLLSIGIPLVPHLRDILHTKDATWQYWVITLIIAKSPEIAASLKDDLVRFVNEPTPDEQSEELHIHAAQIISSLTES